MKAILEVRYDNGILIYRKQVEIESFEAVPLESLQKNSHAFWSFLGLPSLGCHDEVCLWAMDIACGLPLIVIEMTLPDDSTWWEVVQMLQCCGFRQSRCVAAPMELIPGSKTYTRKVAQ